MANENHRAVFLMAHLVTAEIRIPFMDRFRILFGSRIFTNTLVETQRRQQVRTHTKYAVEKTFGSRIRKGECPELFEDIPKGDE